ncbi:MAG: NBR1-Ig-like domain-containing protein, partial [Candidatus Promineifilaceae bacterium]
FLFLTAGCSQLEESVAETIALNTIEPQAPIEALASINSAELNILETFPVQVILVVRGQFINDCTVIDRVDQAQGGNTFAVEVIALSPSPVNATCLPVPTEYEQQVPLDVADLRAGTYAVNVNGNIQTFTLAVDNFIQEAADLPAPTEEIIDGSGDAYTLTGSVWHDLCAVIEKPVESGPQASVGCINAVAGGFVANGSLEANEPPLVGVELVISLGVCPGGDPFATATTDEAGNYSFTNLRPDSYCVGVPISAEPNATILIPGLWTSPNLEGRQTVEISADTTATPFGWDYQFLPNPDSVEFDSVEGGNTVLNDPGCIHLAAFDGDVTIPDDAPYEPNTPVTKIWRFVNTGSCGWGAGYSLRFATGDLMNASTSVPIEEATLPGEAILIEVDMVTPDTVGTYQGDWLFSTPDNELFGIGEEDLAVWVRLQVVEPNTLGSISGVFWNDLCDSTGFEYGVSALPAGCFLNENGTIRGDGVFDAGAETPIANVQLELGTGECGDAEPLVKTRTDSAGNYKFQSLSPGTYCVYVEVLTEANFPILVPGDFTAPSPSRAGVTIDLALDQDVDSADFGWDFQEEVDE